MSLAPGARLGPYEIVAAIGSGGMGEVYRARDTKLNRDVALKVLPDAFATDADRLARFKREAQVLASLNHPNIASIYGLEDTDGVKALVLELVEGPTLADRIAKGPIPIDEALPIARQIADALEAAHERGIIHRDLKPANIKLRSDGTVKVLDFGLAKALGPAEAGHYDNPDAMSQSPTITSPAMTQMGIILGTAAYMSPEQARGRPVDKRTDIWAFGCVFYEMLTGRRAFEGEDVTVTVAAIVRGEPDWSALPPELSPSTRTTLQRCLSKDPKQRVRDIGDVSLVLHGAFDVPLGQPAVMVAPKPARWRQAMVGVAGIVVTAIISGGAMWSLTRRAPIPPPSVQRLSIVLPSAASLFYGLAATPGGMALSPDGRRLVYVAERNLERVLYLRQLDQDQPEPLRGTEGAARPTFSPDGAWIAFFADGKLKKTSVGGGTPITLCDINARPRPSELGISGISWGLDDQIVFAASSDFGVSSRLFRVTASGGKPEPLVDPKGDNHGFPEFLPGSKDVLFNIGATPGTPTSARIAVLSLATGTIKTILDQGNRPRYLPSGHLVYALTGSLMVAPFDLNSLATTGPAVPLMDGVTLDAIAVSQNGTLVYAPEARVRTVTPRSLVWVDRQGRATAAITERAAYRYPRLSRDGQRVAVGIGDDIWVLGIERPTRTRLTSGDRATEGPAPLAAWTPDGQRVTFSSRSRSNPAEYALEWTNADGSGQRQVLFKSNNFGQPGSWSSDGKTLVFYQVTQASNGRDLWALRPGNEPTPFLTTRFEERAPHLSPDGRWLAYVSDASGADEVYLRPFPASDAQQITVSTEGGTEPVWSRNGRELFYRNGARVMVVPVTLSPTLSLGQPRLLFEGAYLLDTTGGKVPFYDVAADGQRFLMVADETPASGPILNLTVVLNWFEELKQKTFAKSAP